MYRKRPRKTSTNLYLYYGIFLCTRLLIFGQLSFLNEYYAISFITITKITIFVSRNKTHFKISSFIKIFSIYSKLGKNSYKFLPSYNVNRRLVKLFIDSSKNLKVQYKRVHKLPYLSLWSISEGSPYIKQHEREKQSILYSSALKEMKTLQTKKNVFYIQVWLHLQNW